jgi:hypothetical protein
MVMYEKMDCSHEDLVLLLQLPSHGVSFAIDYVMAHVLGV